MSARVRLRIELRTRHLENCFLRSATRAQFSTQVFFALRNFVRNKRNEKGKHDRNESVSRDDSIAAKFVERRGEKGKKKEIERSKNKLGGRMRVFLVLKGRIARDAFSAPTVQRGLHTSFTVLRVLVGAFPHTPELPAEFPSAMKP